MNPVTKEKCSTPVSTTGTKTECLKWHIYKDNGNGTYQLILDHNTTNSIQWNSTYKLGTTQANPEMLEVAAQLENDIEDWHTSLKTNNARLITADEVAEIVGANLSSTIKWNSTKKYGTYPNDSISWFYFDGRSNPNPTSYSETDGWQKQYADATNVSDYAWLYNNMTKCKQYGYSIETTSVATGYWTSTYCEGRGAWGVNPTGKLELLPSNITLVRGIRPVITVSKSEVEVNY